MGLTPISPEENRRRSLKREEPQPPGAFIPTHDCDINGRLILWVSGSTASAVSGGNSWKQTSLCVYSLLLLLLWRTLTTNAAPTNNHLPFRGLA